MTSVPKPLKFLRPHYATMAEIYADWIDSENKVNRCVGEAKTEITRKKKKKNDIYYDWHICGT